MMSYRDAEHNMGLAAAAERERRQSTPRRVVVPDIEDETLCFKQKLDPPNAMTRCTYLKNHDGRHSWEV